MVRKSAPPPPASEVGILHPTNEDTDLCLQVLASGWCTALINLFMIEKVATLTMKGGNTDQLYKQDGRLTMAQSLKRDWPGVVDVKRKFGRAQHEIKNQWRGFNTPLKPKPGVDAAATFPLDLKLIEVRPTENQRIKAIVAQENGS